MIELAQIIEQFAQSPLRTPREKASMLGISAKLREEGVGSSVSAEALRRKEQAIARFKEAPHSQSAITELWAARMRVIGEQLGIDIRVFSVDRTAEEIEELASLPHPRKLVFVPPELTGAAGTSWLLGEHLLVNNTNGDTGGWVDIEAAIDLPNVGAGSIEEVDQRIAEQGLKPQRFITYILGSQDAYEIQGRHFDPGPRHLCFIPGTVYADSQGRRDFILAGSSSDTNRIHTTGMRVDPYMSRTHSNSVVGYRTERFWSSSTSPATA